MWQIKFSYSFKMQIILYEEIQRTENYLNSDFREIVTCKRKQNFISCFVSLNVAMKIYELRFEPA